MTFLIPQTFIDELLLRVDLVEFIDSYLPLKKHGASYLACCPFHSEKTPSFNVIAKKQFYHCFGCGVSGNAISFAMNYLQQPFPAAVESLARRTGMQVPRPDTVEIDAKTLNLYTLMRRVTQFYTDLLKKNNPQASAYLAERGVDSLVAEKYQLGYAPVGWQTLDGYFKKQREFLIITGMLIQNEQGKVYDRYRNRILFPLHDQHGRVIGFGGRSLDDQQKPKYLHSPETPLFQKNRELYGLYQLLKHAKNVPRILVVEGYMDVIALAQHGINYAVATLGTATSTYHVQRLSKHTQHLFFCFDGDAAGRNAAWKALENSLPHLDVEFEASFVFLPEGHDPDSLVRQEGMLAFEQRLNSATPLHQLFFDTLMQPLDNRSLSGKGQLISSAKPYMLKMQDGPYKQLMMQELSRRTHLESHRVHQYIDAEVIMAPAKHREIKRTPVRVATSLILQYPEIYTACKQHLDAYPFLGHPTLKSILQQIDTNPKITTASLVEIFRDDPAFDALNMLVTWEHQGEPEALRREFMDIMVFLCKQDREESIQRLLEYSRAQPLDSAQRQTLQRLLKERHQTH